MVVGSCGGRGGQAVQGLLQQRAGVGPRLEDPGHGPDHPGGAVGSVGQDPEEGDEHPGQAWGGPLQGGALAGQGRGRVLAAKEPGGHAWSGLPEQVQGGHHPGGIAPGGLEAVVPLAGVHRPPGHPPRVQADLGEAGHFSPPVPGPPGQGREQRVLTTTATEIGLATRRLGAVSTEVERGRSRWGSMPPGRRSRWCTTGPSGHGR